MASLTHPTALINCCIFLFLLNKNASPILIRLLYNFVRGTFFNPANAQYAALIYEIKMHVFNTHMIFGWIQNKYLRNKEKSHKVTKSIIESYV